MQVWHIKSIDIPTSNNIRAVLIPTFKKAQKQIFLVFTRNILDISFGQGILNRTILGFIISKYIEVIFIKLQWNWNYRRTRILNMRESLIGCHLNINIGNNNLAHVIINFIGIAVANKTISKIIITIYIEVGGILILRIEIASIPNASRFEWIYLVPIQGPILCFLVRRFGRNEDGWIVFFFGFNPFAILVNAAKIHLIPYDFHIRIKFHNIILS